jgi:hypothetical protein
MPNENPWVEDKQPLKVPRSSLVLMETDKDEHGNEKPRNGITEQNVKSLLEERTEKLSTAKGILEIHPDLRLVREILIAQTLSPKDLSDFKLRLAVNRGIYKKEVKADLLTELTAMLNTEFNLEENIPEWVGDALFDHGAKIHLIMPPANIDALINQAALTGIDQESLDSITDGELFNNVGIVNPSNDVKNELKKLAGVDQVFDNWAQMYKPTLREAARERHVSKTTGIDMENYTFAAAPVFGAFGDGTRPGRESKPVEIEVEEELRKEAVAIPMEISVDACLAIGHPGNRKNHVGYYFLVDKHGYITSSVEESTFMSDLLNRLKRALHDDQSEEFQVIRGMDVMNGKEEKKKTAAQFMDAWVRKIEEPIKKMIKDSNVVDGDVEITEYKAFYRIMLSRALKKQETRLLYVPAEMVSYIAFNYNEWGQGTSMLERTAYYSSIRAILQIVSMMSMVHNSLPHTELNVTLDENDTDGMGTIETLLHELSKMTSMNFPVGSVNPSEIMTSVQKALYRIKVDGGNKFPRTTTEMSDVSRSKTTIDTTLEEDLKRKQYAGMEVTPEAVDQSLQGEFATAYILNDLLAAKRAMRRQRKLKPQIARHIYKLIRFSPKIIMWLKEKGINDKDMHDFVRSLDIILPAADQARIEQQAEAYEAYSRLIDDVMESFITDDMLRGIAGFADSDYTRDILDDTRAIFSSALKRQWLSDNNVLGEIWRLIDKDGDDSLVDSIKDHYKNSFDAIGPIVVSVLKGISKTDNEILKFIDSKKDEEGNSDFDNAPRPGVGTPFNSEGDPFATDQDNIDGVGGEDDPFDEGPGAEGDPADPFAADDDDADLDFLGGGDDDVIDVPGAEQNLDDPEELEEGDFEDDINDPEEPELDDDEGGTEDVDPEELEEGDFDEEPAEPEVEDEDPEEEPEEENPEDEDPDEEL